MRVSLTLSFILILAPFPCAGETQHELKIGTFADGIISSSSAQRTVDSINEIVANSGSPECAGVMFKIVLGPEKYGPTIPKSVENGNLSQFRASGYSVNVVSQIRECGGFPVARGQSFAGCTNRGSFPVALIASNWEMRPFLWLHELGHSQGLLDRCDDREDGCRSNIGWVMAGVLDKRNINIGSDECRALDGEQNFPILVEDGASVEASVQEILEQDWNHAMPVLSLLEFDENDTAFLREVLQSADISLWPNAVLALGLTGSAEDAEAILSVLDRSILSEGSVAEPGEVDFNAVNAKLNVPIALGYLANQTQSGEAIRNFERLLSPERNIPLFDGFADPDATAEYGAALARNVAVGLSLSDMTAGGASNLQAREIFDRNFTGANRSSTLNMDEPFVESLNNLSADVSTRGLAEVLLDNNAPEFQ